MIRIENASAISEFGYLVTNHTLYESDLAGVYILHNENNKIIYVGQSKNMRQRLLSHCKNENKDWKYAYIIPINHNDHRLYTESILIRYLNPLNNKTNGYPKHYEWDIKDITKLQCQLMDATKQIDFMTNLYINQKYPS
jgi:predicted GIY-YIG superfamily endonuclease